MDYPLELDIYDLCSEDLRKKLEAPRQVCTVYLWWTKFYLSWLIKSTDRSVFQKLRDEEGKKFGLKTNAESSSKDTDVKMTDAEVPYISLYL